MEPMFEFFRRFLFKDIPGFIFYLLNTEAISLGPLSPAFGGNIFWPTLELEPPI